MDIEKTYYRARERYLQAVDRLTTIHTASAYAEFQEAQEQFFCFCTVTLEALIEENADVLKRLGEADREYKGHGVYTSTKI